ncbi:histone H1-like [Neoarius graeffei]|uniref:histone H1-like n=1 Tax=Neoarius graeffei TaxID=443677 RepID=UPI00298C675F|nr:histone H1-like [Neoarius graeffei]
MAEVAPAAAPAKAPKKKAASKSKKSGPSVGELIIKAVSASQERSGVSLSALKKALQAAGYDVEKNNSRVKIAVKNLVRKSVLVQTKGTGASGSFKLNKTQTEGKKPAKKAAPKARKAAAEKPTAAKKPKKIAAKKPAAKKSPKKAKKPPAAAKKSTKSPKKAKKPSTPKKAAKSAKKTKTAKPKAVKPKTAKAKKAAPKKK